MPSSTRQIPLFWAAGPKLLEECGKLNGCPTGGAKLTKGYDLPAKYVIHAVGPVWNGGRHGEAGKLQSCYWNSLEIARAEGLKTIAFPCISTGAYRYPAEEAAKIAVTSADRHFQETGCAIEVTFCCFSDHDLQIYQKLLTTGS